MDSIADSLGSEFDVLVLPDSDHKPPCTAKFGIRALISRLVPLELCRPIPLVARRLGSMLRTAVPEAPIKEDSDLRPREYDVGVKAELIRCDPPVLAKPKPATVERRAERDFGSSVTLSVAAHRCRHRGRRRTRICGGRDGPSQQAPLSATRRKFELTIPVGSDAVNLHQRRRPEPSFAAEPTPKTGEGGLSIVTANSSPHKHRHCNGSICLGQRAPSAGSTPPSHPKPADQKPTPQRVLRRLTWDFV